MNNKIGILGRGKDAVKIFQTLINTNGIKLSNIYIPKNIFFKNVEYMQLFYNFDVTKILKKYNKIEIKNEPNIIKLNELTSLLHKINYTKKIRELVNTVDILFLCLRNKNIKLFLEMIIEDIKKDCHLIIVNSSCYFDEMEYDKEKFKISKINPSITPINQFVVKLCYNKNVNKEDLNILYEIFNNFGSIYDYGNDEEKFHIWCILFIFYFI
jgi:pyrroline-5-carboxylate reductase